MLYVRSCETEVQMEGPLIIRLELIATDSQDLTSLMKPSVKPLAISFVDEAGKEIVRSEKFTGSVGKLGRKMS